MKPEQALALIDRLPPATLPEFDYSVLSADVAKDASAVAERIRERHRASIVETGRDLIAMKEKLGHGNFLPWTAAEFGWSRQTAHRFMNVART
jgi:AMMECR1 domain-containing protein